MWKKILAISMALTVPAPPGARAIEQMWAADETAREARDEQIYGSQLMTDQERADYRQKIRDASSENEREKIRADHHELMQERARTRGITLPDEPHDGMGRDGMMQHGHDGHDHKNNNR